MFWPIFLHGSTLVSTHDTQALDPGSLEVRDDVTNEDGGVAEEDDEGDEGDDEVGDREEDWDGHTSLRTTSNRSPPRWYLRIRNFFKSPPPPDTLEYIPNYRYTPIFSGIVIPFSILLGIPGLTEDWYIRTADNKIVETRPNTVILDVGMGLSMASALLANVCLISRFLEKRVKTMTLACIFFLTIHDMINIVTVTTFGVEHRVDDGFTYSQAFWMVVCSTIASTFTNVTLIVDFFRTPNFAKSGSGLTRKQRSLVIIVIILLCYIALGALVHTYLIGLTFINALYFTVVTIETVGLGDITPSSAGGRVFVCIYAAIGVVNLALAVGLARETVLEAMEVAYRKRLRSVRTRRRELRKRARAQDRWRQAIEWRLKEANQPLWVKDDGVHPRTSVWGWLHAKRVKGFGHHVGDAYFGNNPHGMHLNLDALTNAQLESAALEAGVPLSTLLPPDFWSKRKEELHHHDRPEKGRTAASSSKVDEELPLTHARLGRMVTMLGNFAHAVYLSGTLAGDVAPPTPPRMISGPRSQSYSSRGRLETFHAEVEKEERLAFYASLTIAWGLFLVFWFVGTIIFHVTEGWPFGTTMYFCFMAFMTIGYGDFAPETPTGRSIFVVWALLGIATMTILISIVSEAYTYRYKGMLRSEPFLKAVKRYRAEKNRYEPSPQRPFALGGSGEKRSDSRIPGSSDPSSLRSPANRSNDGGDPNLSAEAISRKREIAQAQLEALPRLILQHTQLFQEHVRYFTGKGRRDRVPDGVRALVDDIAGTAELGERVKSEMLQDDDSRQTLFALGIEDELKKIIRIAEDALGAMNERDQVESLHNDKPLCLDHTTHRDDQ